ncbi:MAG: AgmX/PglI C-terminal domain-containing protein [Deltaproteobacteria bacterium]|nr:AgmX/PglI C-terminal domain-containing protein [Deltaproteobacteria bacterium]
MTDPTPTPPAPPLPDPEHLAFEAGQRDYRFTRILSTSLMAHLLFIGALLFTPLDPLSFSEEMFRDPNRFTALLIRPPERKAHFGGPLLERPRAIPRKEEGTFGRPDAARRAAAPSREGAPLVDVSRRERDRERMMKTGLLGLLNDEERRAEASNIFGPAGLGSGINNALGALTPGASMGDAHGVGGLGSRGLGPGGGGDAVGIGGLGTRRGDRGPGGPGGLELEGHEREPPPLEPEATLVRGGLDREVIARVVRRHQSAIKYCYERSLQKDPELHGKVAVVWVIDGTGAVASAEIARSTLDDGEVEACILQRVRRWRFPEPRGGGVVQVTYPWIFKPSS